MIATDSAISIVTGVVKIGVFAVRRCANADCDHDRTVDGAGRLSLHLSSPSPWCQRMPVHVHTAILDAIVIVGGGIMIYGALLQ